MQSTMPVRSGGVPVRKISRPLRTMSVPDDFAIETKLVVLNFMGLVPAPSSCPATAPVSDMNRSNGSGSLESSLFGHHGLATVEELCDSESFSRMSDLNESFTEQDFQGLTESFIRGVMGERKDALGSDEEYVANEAPLTTRTSFRLGVTPPSSPSHSWSGNQPELLPPSPLQITMAVSQPVTETLSSQTSSCPVLSVNSLPQTTSPQPWMLQAPSLVQPSVSPRTPSPRAMTSPLAERQSSARSSGSIQSRSSIARGTYIDVLSADVESLVRTRALSPLVLPLREEIYRELDDMEHSASATSARPALTPESEVADMLRTLGDRVQEEFGEELERAVAELLPVVPAAGGLTYAALRATALRLLHVASPGWTQVALVLLLGQRVALTMLMRGDRSIGQVAEHVTQFIDDNVADFIIANGGWHSILELDSEDLCPEDPDLRAMGAAREIGQSETNSLSPPHDTDGQSGQDTGDGREHLNIVVRSENDTQQTEFVPCSTNGSSNGCSEVLTVEKPERRVQLLDDLGGQNFVMYVTVSAFVVITAVILFQRAVRS